MAKQITTDPYIPYSPNQVPTHGGHGGGFSSNAGAYASEGVKNGMANNAANSFAGSAITGAANGAMNASNSFNGNNGNGKGNGKGNGNGYAYGNGNGNGDWSGLSDLYNAIIGGLGGQLDAANKLAQARKAQADALAKDQLYQNNRQTVNENNHMRKLYDERYGGDITGASITNRGRLAANLANNLAGNRRDYTSVLQNNLNDYYSALAQNQGIYNQNYYNYALSPIMSNANTALQNGYNDLYRELVDKIKR